jgi:putative SOS response-associated peptidase YedK
MCGRFVVRSSPEEIRRLLGYEDTPNFPPRYNVAPTQPIAIVRMERGKRRFALVRWGLVPSWGKDPKRFSLLINARAEGITQKASFRAAMLRRRCLVPADGFYEWQRTPGGKRPFYIHARHGGPMAFAGLWETWMDAAGGEIETAALVTCRANAMLAPIHDRMPVVLAPEHFASWLDTEHVGAEQASELLTPAPEDLLQADEISSRVNDHRNEGAELIEPVAAKLKAPSRG